MRFPVSRSEGEMIIAAALVLLGLIAFGCGAYAGYSAGKEFYTSRSAGKDAQRQVRPAPDSRP